MNDALKKLESLLHNAAAGPQPFPPTSRYNGLPIRTHVTPDGRTLAYLSRRIVPPPENFATVQTHTVSAQERLDTIAARYLGDSEQWWRLADGNGAIRPDELVEREGHRLRITLAEGIPAGGDD